MSETQQQKALIKWFRLNYPELEMLLFSIPNGANFSSASNKQRYGQVNKLKAEGMKKGVPDLMLAFPCNGFAGLFLEMKDEGKTLCSLSKEQAAYIETLNAVGYCAVWCAGFDVAKAAIVAYLADYIPETIH